MKNLFRLPALLLVLCIPIWFLYMGNTSLDIHLHDTYYVIGGYSLESNFFFLPIYLMLFFSWMMHLLLRRKGLLPSSWQWIQVVISLICLFVFVASLNSAFLPRRYYDSVDNYSAIRAYGITGMYGLVIFVLCQLLFWITAAALFIKKARAR